MKCKNTLLMLCLSFLCASTYAQQAVMKGRVLDTLQQPVSFANVLGVPQAGKSNIAFALTDEQGFYKLELSKNTLYHIEIRHIGYEKIIFPILLTQDSATNSVLSPANELLKEVIVIERLPVVVKNDTVVYRAEAFTNGREQKLGEVLKKLPGVEVDREGNVSVNGKKVDKLLVDGNTFFTGSVKLGANNIPAGVVDEVEVISNYSETSFLKGFNKDETTAINIKLKKDRKRFAFGNIEAGGGIKNRFIVHPTLFNYSAKTTVNFIGDFNNIGHKSFTIYDYLNFEGGIAKFASNPISLRNLLNNDFVRSLADPNVLFNQHKFGAFNLMHKVSSTLKVNTYTINNAYLIKKREENNNEYLIDNKVVNTEIRNTQTSANNFFTLNKVDIEYTPSAEERFDIKIGFKHSKGDLAEYIHSITLQNKDAINSILKPYSWEFSPEVVYSRRFSQKFSTTINANFRKRVNRSQDFWALEKPIFPRLIPSSNDTSHDISQTVQSRDDIASISTKSRWVINDLNHIYVTAGYDYSRQRYATSTYGVADKQFIDFYDAGFNNQVLFTLNAPFMGVGYDVKIRKVTLSSNFNYHNYNWEVYQFQEKDIAAAKLQFLPEMSLKWDIKQSERFSVKYGLVSQFNDASFFANRLRLNRFNALYRGSVELENAISQRFSMRYYKSNQIRKYSYNIDFSYQKKIYAIQHQSIVEGINQIGTALYTALPDNNVALNALFSKFGRYVTYKVKGSTSHEGYYRTINNAILPYKSQAYSYTFITVTSFKKNPVVEMSFTQSLNNFSSNLFENKFAQNNFFLTCTYNFLRSFDFKAEYNYNNYRNKNYKSRNTFHLCEASLSYQKEDTRWGFQAAVENLFNVSFRSQNTLNQFVISDMRTFIQPRTIVLKALYKI